MVFGQGSEYLDFYSLVNDTTLFETHETDAVIDEVAENYVIRKVQRMFKDRESRFWVKSFKRTIRPKEQSQLKEIHGMSFDIVLPLVKPYDGKSFLVIDIYTRFPVTDEIIGRFAKKIELVGKVEGLIFATISLNAESLQGRSGEHFIILLLERVKIGRSGPIIYRDIREKIVAKQSA